jgi:hypothetical protein
MTKVGTTVVASLAMLAASGLLAGGAQAREWSVEVVEHGVPADSETGVRITVGYDKSDSEWGAARTITTDSELTVLNAPVAGPSSRDTTECTDSDLAQTVCDVNDLVVDAIP